MHVLVEGAAVGMVVGCCDTGVFVGTGVLACEVDCGLLKDGQIKYDIPVGIGVGVRFKDELGDPLVVAVTNSRVGTSGRSDV